MSLQETAASSPGIKYVRVNSVSAPEPVSVWAVVETDTGKERGFVASVQQPYEANSPEMYSPVKWTYAVRQDELTSATSFPYAGRAHASLSLLNKQ